MEESRKSFDVNKSKDAALKHLKSYTLSHQSVERLNPPCNVGTSTGRQFCRKCDIHFISILLLPPD